MNHHATDTELLDAIRIDDATAFEDLMGRYWFFLYQYAYGKTQSKKSAAEITRNIFIEIWENRHFIPADFSLQAYLREKVRKSATYHLYKRIVEERPNKELATYLDNEFSFDNIKSAYRPVSQSTKDSPETGTYRSRHETTPKKIEEPNYFFAWKLLVNNLVVGFKRTFF